MATGSDFAFRMAAERKRQERLKCCVIGNDNVGKTSLIRSFIKRDFHNQTEPQIFESITLGTGKGSHSLLIVDAESHRNETPINAPSLYTGTDAFILCFSVVDPSSFHDITQKWIPKIQGGYSDAPFLLVGTQIDLRSDQTILAKLRDVNQAPITSGTGEGLAKRLGATKYIECSALTRVGVATVFEEVVNAVQKPSRVGHKDNQCTIF